MIPPAQAVERNVLSQAVVHEIGGAVQERVIPRVGPPERRARRREVEDPTREARARVVDEQGLSRVVDVVHHERTGPREAEDRPVLRVAVELEPRRSAAGRLPVD